MTLRKWRQKHGVSQIELARRIGRTQGAVHQIEKGTTHPNAETAQRIVDATNNEVGYEDLYGPKAAA